MTDNSGLKLVDLDEAGVDRAFRADVLSGMREAQKAIPARWLYDDAGSQLYEDITQVPEYYPARAETEILKTRGADFAEAIGKGRAVVEFGSGSSVKTPALLSAIQPAAYVPLDIAGDFLRAAAADLAAKYLTRGQGGLVGFELKDGAEAGKRFIDALQLFYHVANIGDARSLAIHPASTTHSQLTADEQAATGVSPGYVRLSIGIEHIDDILADLGAALDAA